MSAPQLGQSVVSLSIHEGPQRRTDVLRFGFVPAFFETVEHVLALVALVGAQPADEVVERLLEPGDQSAPGLRRVYSAWGGGLTLRRGNLFLFCGEAVGGGGY